MRRKHFYHPPKEPCIYFLEIYLDNKWHILYIGETEKLTQRLYNHVKEKKDWGVKGKSRYFYISAPKDRKVRRYFEAYLVVKFQPLLQQGLKMKNYIGVVMNRETREEKKTKKRRALPVPGYGKHPVLPGNKNDFKIHVTTKEGSAELQKIVDKTNEETFSNTALAKPDSHIKTIHITESKSKFLFRGAELWVMDLQKLSVRDFKKARFLLSVIANRAQIYKVTSEEYVKIRQELPTHINYIKLNFEETAMFKYFMTPKEYSFLGYNDTEGKIYEPLYCLEHASFVLEKTKPIIIEQELRKQQYNAGWKQRAKKKKLAAEALEIQKRLTEIHNEIHNKQDKV